MMEVTGGRATLGGKLTLGVVPILWLGPSFAVFVRPCLDSSRLDTASASNGLVDPGRLLRRRQEGRTGVNVRCDVEFIYNAKVALAVDVRDRPRGKQRGNRRLLNEGLASKFGCGMGTILFDAPA